MCSAAQSHAAGTGITRLDSTRRAGTRRRRRGHRQRERRTPRTCAPPAQGHALCRTRRARGAGRARLLLPRLRGGTALLCHGVARDGRFTWGSAAAAVIGMEFSPLSAHSSFSLPAALWLHDVTTRGGPVFRVLATHGLGAIVAFDGNAFSGAERRPASGSPDGGLFPVHYSVADGALAERDVSAALGCALPQELPRVMSIEPPSAASAVKWLGPGATSASSSLRGAWPTTSTTTSRAGSARPAHTVTARTALPAHRATLSGHGRAAVVCPGLARRQSGHDQVRRRARPLLRRLGRRQAMPADSFCPGGLSAPRRCPDGSHSHAGAWTVTQCV